MVLKLKDNEFISSSIKNESNSNELFLLSYDQKINNVNIYDNYIGAHSNIIEAIVSLNNRVFLTSDSFGNLKIWNIKNRLKN